jgi:hypothetical protein
LVNTWFFRRLLTYSLLLGVPSTSLLPQLLWVWLTYWQQQVRHVVATALKGGLTYWQQQVRDVVATTIVGVVNLLATAGKGCCCHSFKGWGEPINNSR